jgi:hypothetical protein
VFGRRKDRIVKAPEEGSRQAPGAQAHQLPPGHSIYFNDTESGAFVPLDGALYARIQSGAVRM